MSKISAIIPKLNFTINFKNPNPTKYQMPQPKADIHTGFKNNIMYSRRISKQTDRPDIFTHKK